DGALHEFAAELCPADLRPRLRDAGLRCELALPTGRGGLGIPLASRDAPFRAAEAWRREEALATLAPPALIDRVYRRDDSHRWKAVTVDGAHKAAEDALVAPAEWQAHREWTRRRELNKLRGAM